MVVPNIADATDKTRARSGRDDCQWKPSEEYQEGHWMNLRLQTHVITLIQI